MRVAIVGCGRSGTSMASEIFAGSSILKSPSIVNRDVLKNLKFPNNMVTKLSETGTWSSYSNFEKLMNKYDDLKIIWSVRDPRDIIMSKMRRGEPMSKGGDAGPKGAGDGTPITSVADVKDMKIKYEKSIKLYGDRIYLLKMEDVILNFEESVTSACNFIGINYEEEMRNFYKRMRDKKKKKRYKKIDTDEVQKWKRWKTEYNGYFINKKIELEKLFEKLDQEIKYFGYK